MSRGRKAHDEKLSFISRRDALLRWLPDHARAVYHPSTLVFEADGTVVRVAADGSRTVVEGE